MVLVIHRLVLCNSTIAFFVAAQRIISDNVNSWFVYYVDFIFHFNMISCLHSALQSFKIIAYL